MRLKIAICTLIICLCCIQTNNAQPNKPIVEYSQVTTMFESMYAYFAASKYDEALEQIFEIQNIIEQYENTKSDDYAITLDFIARIYTMMANYDKALEYAVSSLNLRGELSGEHSTVYAESLNTIGFIYDKKSMYDKAIEYYRSALNILFDGETGTNHQYYATILSNIGVILIQKGEYADAIKVLLETMAIQENTISKNHLDYARSLLNLSYAYSSIEEYESAIATNHEALELYNSLSGSCTYEYAMCLNTLGSIYVKLGDYNRGIKYTEQATKIHSVVFGENHPEYALSLNNLAMINYHCNKYGEAITLFTQALKIQSEAVGVENAYYILFLNNITQSYTQLGVYDKAIKLQEFVIDGHSHIFGDKHPSYALALNNMGFILYNKSSYKEAINYYKKALDIYTETLGANHNNTITAKSSLACLYSFLGENERALAEYSSILYMIIDKALNHFSFLDNNGRAHYWSTQSNYIKMVYQSASISDSYSTLSYDAALFSKGLILASTIELRKLILESGDQELLSIYSKNRNIEIRLQGINIDKEMRDSLEKQSDYLNRELMTRSKEFGDFTRNLSIDWSQVQASLHEDDIAVELIDYTPYKSDTTHYAALLLRKGWKNPRMVPLTTDKELNKFLRNKSRIYEGFQSKELYKQIWSKIEPFVKEGDNIYFSPTGALHQMNIEILTDSNGVQANKKYNLHRVSSTRELCYTKEPQPYRTATLYGGLRYDMDSTQMISQSRSWGERNIYAYHRGLPTDSTERVGWSYLPSSKIEVDNIATKMEQSNIKSVKYVEEVGTEESFKALSGSKTPIIHIATHGFFLKDEEAKERHYMRQMMMGDQNSAPRDNSMKRSGLIMSGGQKAWLGEEIPAGIDDGILLSEEISTLDLRGTDLVILSACDTALGEVNSEGVFGLQRAFKMSGVETVIMSLWRVSDAATSLMMQTFYDKLLSGKTKREAFLETQEVVKSQFPEPYYWASFIMLD